MKAPARGEVWIVDLGLAAKVRPGLVISVAPTEVESALVTVEPRTTSLRSTRFEVKSEVGFLKAGAFDAQSLVTIPFARLVRRLGHVNPEQLAAVERAVCAWLGIAGRQPEGAG